MKLTGKGLGSIATVNIKASNKKPVAKKQNNMHAAYNFSEIILTFKFKTKFALSELCFFFALKNYMANSC